MTIPTALYRYFDDKNRLLYIGITDNLANRENGHIRRSSWMQLVASSTVKRYSDREDALVAERSAIKGECPLFNRQYNDTVAARKRVKAYLEEIGRMDLYDPRRYTGNVPLGELEMKQARAARKTEAERPPSENSTFNVIPGSRSQVVLLTIAALQDSTLSLAARGLLAFVVSMPHGSTFTTEWLADQGPDGEESVFAALAELEASGYYKDGVISDGKPNQVSDAA